MREKNIYSIIYNIYIKYNLKYKRSGICSAVYSDEAWKILTTTIATIQGRLKRSCITWSGITIGKSHHHYHYYNH